MSMQMLTGKEEKANMTGGRAAAKFREAGTAAEKWGERG